MRQKYSDKEISNLKTNKLKKNAIKIAILLGVIAVTMGWRGGGGFAGQNSNISLVMTVIFASVIYAYMKDFSTYMKIIKECGFDYLCYYVNREKHLYYIK